MHRFLRSNHHTSSKLLVMLLIFALLPSSARPHIKNLQAQTARADAWRNQTPRRDFNAPLAALPQFVGNSLSSLTAPDEAIRARISARYGKRSLSFEINQGQTDARVKFAARGAAYNLFLTGNDAVLSLRKSESNPKGKGRASIDEPPHDRLRASSSSRQSASARLQMKLIGANRASQIIGEDEQAGKSNYFIGNDATKWRTDVAHYGRVRYKEVYRGIDQIYYGNQGELEYDFIVSPNADYRQIRLQFAGAQKIKVDKRSGDLILTTRDGGEVRQHKPVVYQEAGGERRAIAGEYVRLRKREIGFHIGEYDRRVPLIIDPTLVYSTYLGGTGGEYGQAIAVDATGNAYVIGVTSSLDFPTKNPVQAGNAGGGDAFIAKR